MSLWKLWKLNLRVFFTPPQSLLKPASICKGKKHLGNQIINEHTIANLTGENHKLGWCGDRAILASEPFGQIWRMIWMKKKSFFPFYHSHHPPPLCSLSEATRGLMRDYKEKRGFSPHQTTIHVSIRNYYVKSKPKIQTRLISQATTRKKNKKRNRNSSSSFVLP